MPGIAPSDVKLLAHLTVLTGLLLAFWIALTDNTRPWELLVGGVCAVVAAVCGIVVHRAGGGEFAIEPRWLRHVPGILWSIVSESLLVMRAALSPTPPRGRMRAVPCGALGEGALAVASSLGSAAPNLYVVAEDEAQGVLLIHELVPTAAVSGLDAVDAS